MTQEAPLSNEHIRNTVRAFILRTFLTSTDAERLTDGVSLERSHIVDSTGMLELIVFLERTFSITIAVDDAVPENLDSVDAIVAFVARLLQAR